MIQPIWNAARGRMRVAGLASGSGNTLWKALELQKTLEATPDGCPFEIVAVFADSPDAKALRTAEEFGIPGLSADIQAFYADRGAPLKDRSVRAEYDRLRRTLDVHDAEHAVMECLGETLWHAQRHGTALDSARYLECLRRAG